VSIDHPILAHITAKLVQYQQLALAIPIKRWVIAYSGGQDSTVLLHAVVSANQLVDNPLPIVALHVNHQLSKNAEAWECHCQQYAGELGVSWVTQMVDVKVAGKGTEAAARDARYRIFESYLKEGDGLLFGHHQNDQAETVLLRVFRGAGVRGLGAMPEWRPIAGAMLFRPLLTITQSAIQAYAQQARLTWVDDESNSQDDYDRNFLRNRIIPLLCQRWPMLVRQLSALAERMKQTDGLLNELAAEDLQRVDLQSARTGQSVDLGALSLLSLARKHNVIRHWCTSLHYALPDSCHLSQIEQQFFSGHVPLSSACVSWTDVEVRQFAGRLYLMRTLSVGGGLEGPLRWACDGALFLGEGRSLQLVQEDKIGLRIPKPPADRPYYIRWRQGGERCTPVQRQHSQTVKKLLQEFGLETWLRNRVPLIYAGDDLVAVGDLWLNKGYEVDDLDTSVLISWGAE
jgi:tRNA(Ile)-lysidine synthase